MADFCKNCGTCTCTGVTLLKARNGKECCSACIQFVNQEINYVLASTPGLTIQDLKRSEKFKKQ